MVDLTIERLKTNAEIIEETYEIYHGCRYDDDTNNVMASFEALEGGEVV